MGSEIWREMKILICPVSEAGMVTLMATPERAEETAWSVMMTTMGQGKG